MNRPCQRILLYWLLQIPLWATSQSAGFDSFIQHLAQQYKVDVAVAPELIPTLDSLRQGGAEFNTLDELLVSILKDHSISYQIVDGNKLMLRRDNHAGNPGQYTISGKITDKRSSTPMPFATVSSMDGKRGTHSDEFGAFTLSIGEADAYVTISYLGYLSQRVPVNGNNAQMLNIQLEEDPVPLREVTIIVPYRNMSSNGEDGAVDLNGYELISEADLLAWNSERLLHAMTAYTSFSGDGGLRIRGSDALNTMVLMDGLPVYDPYHFYNIFSPYNGLYFSSVEIYKNNFPVEHGGRIDGLVKLSSDRVKPKSRLILDSDLLLTSFAAEIGNTQNFNLILGGRISHTDLLQESLGDSSVTNFRLPGTFLNDNEWTSTQEPVFDFYDLNGGLHVALSPSTRMSLNGFKSKDQLDTRTRSAVEINLPLQGVIAVEQLYLRDESWENQGAVFSFEHRMASGGAFRFNAHSSRYLKEVSFQSKLTEERMGMPREIQGKGFNQDTLISSGAKIFLENPLQPGQAFKLGAEAQWHDVVFFGRENNFRFVEQTQQEQELTLFGEWRDGDRTAWDWSLGGRATHLKSTDLVYLLPHVDIRYFFDQAYSLRASYARDLQAVRTLTTEDRFGRETAYLVLSEPEKNYPALTSNKWMIGAGYTSTHWGWDIEVYYKKIDGLVRLRPDRPDPSYGEGTTPEDYYKLFTGEGYAAGVDLTLLYKNKKFESTLYYNLGRLAESFPNIFRGEYFSPQEDRRHQLKLSALQRVGKFNITGLLTYKSKSPYLSYAELANQNGNPDGIGSADKDDITRYLPAYFGLDLGLNYMFALAHQPAQVGVSLINATNHRNIDDLQHLGRINRDQAKDFYLTQQTELLGRTANVHFRIMF